jgi:hypothetical protein
MILSKILVDGRTALAAAAVCSTKPQPDNRHYRLLGDLTKNLGNGSASFGATNRRL